MTAVPGGHRAEPGTPPFPGGVAVSHLRVYDSPSVDGLAGGTPHCHTACTEAYAVVAGRGRVLSLGGDGYQETAIEAGAFVWFTPGTIHRLVNDSGDLEILVLMANAGLPEAGDMVLTFPDEHLADPESYRRSAVLPEGQGLTDADDGAVRARKDLAVAGLAELIDGGPAALERFHRRAAALVAPSVGSWGPIFDAGPRAAVEATAGHLAALAAGDGSHLAASSLHHLPPPPAVRRYGCCGTLGVVQPASISAT
jgi:mannose-6-phosphate isomerase-like protein (cupin superfamily)